MKKLLTALVLACVFLNVQAAYSIKAKEEPIDKTEFLNLNWWKKYNDDKLVDYLLVAYDNNQDLKIAGYNTQQALQVTKMSFAKELPSLSFDGQYQREFESSEIKFGDTVIPNYNQSRFILPLTMAYEFDIWGKNRLKTKSLKVQQEIVSQDEKSAYISLTSAIAANYFNLIKAQNLIKNQKELVELQKEIVKKEEIKHKAGLAPVTELIEEKQALQFFEAELNNLIENEDLLKNKLLVLLGDSQAKISTNEDFNIFPVPNSLSPELIQNRPDVIKSANYIDKSRFDVRIAKKDFLPSFLIYGQVGFNAYQLNRIFTPASWLSAIGVSPSVDLFTGGLKTSILRYKKLEYEKALQGYQKTLLVSLQELNDSLLSAKIAQKNYEKMESNFNFEQNLFNLSEKQIAIGSKSELEHLKAKQALLIAKKNEISAKANCLLTSINIYKAAGGVDYTANETTEQENIWLLHDELKAIIRIWKNL